MRSRVANNRMCGLRSYLTRLVFIVLVSAASIVNAQQSRKMARIGVLDSSNASGMAILLGAFKHELNRLGWVEGKSIAIEYRFAEGEPERLPELAKELVRLNVDVIVITGTPSGLAAKKATTSIPIVMATSADPVGAGLVSSLARPGGNITGLSALSTDLNTKRLEILHESTPKLSRVGVLRLQRGGIAQDLQLQEIRSAAAALNLGLEEADSEPNLKSLERAFQLMQQIPVNGVITTSNRPFFSARKHIVELLAANRLPAIYPQKEYVNEGVDVVWR